jgi:hypothetical protein
MSWWQWLLILIGTVAAGALIGILVGYVYMRVRKKSGPKAAKGQSREKAAANQTAPVKTAPVQTQAAAKAPDKARMTALIKEVETDLAIATVEWKGKLTAFKTDFLDSNRSAFNDLPVGLREDITEAYTDMHLTNTLVTLSKENGHSQKDLEESYLRLRGKVAERLTKVRAAL